LVTPFVGPKVVFLISAALVFMLTFASALAVRVPRTTEVPSHVSNAAVSR
jgi:hypothetical protein